MKGAEKKHRLSGSIEQKVRELWGENARRKRALAKEAKAAERKEDREAEALAKDFCRGLAANWPRPQKKAAARSEAELRKLGGVKEEVLRKDGPQSRIIFGPVGETRFIYTPYRGAWMVALDAKPSLKEELKRVLNRTRRNLWNVPKPEQKPDIVATEQKPAVAEDKQKEKPDIAYQAVEGLLSCFDLFKGLPSDERQAAQVQIAIVATLQALERDVENESRKLQVAFELLEGEGTPSEIGKLQHHAVTLACKLERPPSKKELKDRFDPPLRDYPMGLVGPSKFSSLLKAAGLSWLKRGQRAPSW